MKYKKYLKYIAAFLIPAIFVLMIRQSLDNDSWFVLAEGREIVNNGLYYTDVLSMHEGLEITVQQYGFAAIYWLIYSTFGPAGPYIMMILLNMAVCYLLYKIFKLLSKGNVNLSLVIMVVTDLLLAYGFVVTRAQMVSYVLLLGVIYVLELYIKTNKTKYLWWLPFISLIQINMHASVWLMIILVMMVYIVDSFKNRKLCLQGYRTKPLVLMTILTAVVGLINPYGINMILFIFKNYGAGPIKTLIIEMSSFDLCSTYNVVVYLIMAPTLMVYMLGDGKRIRMRHILMIMGFLALGLNTVKGLSQLILVLFMPMATMYRDMRIEKLIDAEIARRALMFWSAVFATCIFIALIIVVPMRVEDAPNGVAVRSVDALDADVEKSGREKQDLKVFVGYDMGGWLEYKGYKAYIDPRAEVFIGKKSKDDKSILEEYVEIFHGAMNIDEFLNKYQFDYIYALEWDNGLYDLDEKYQYELLYEEVDENDTGLKVWRKKEE